MPTEIIFPDIEARYVFDRDYLAFPAQVDGKPVECLVTAELLMQHFGARGISEEEMREAYQGHRTDIQSLARHHIEMGWIGPDGRVILTTRFTTLKDTYGEGIRQWPEGQALVKKAFRVLAKVIGPTAGEISVEWDQGVDARQRPSITLRLSDATGSVEAAFEPKELENPTQLRIRLSRLLGDLLQIRSRTLMLKSG